MNILIGGSEELARIVAGDSRTLRRNEMERNKSGYTYLKEKVARQQEEISELNSTIDDLRKDVRQLEEELEQLENAQEQKIFNRMVKSIKVGRGWK